MEKTTVEISASGYTGLTPESIEKALHHYFSSPGLNVSFSVQEVAQQSVQSGTAYYGIASPDLGPEKTYSTKELIDRLGNALESGYEELGETDIGDLLLECESVQLKETDNWNCPTCSHENLDMAIKCYFCDSPRPSNDKEKNHA